MTGWTEHRFAISSFLIAVTLSAISSPCFSEIVTSARIDRELAEMTDQQLASARAAMEAFRRNSDLAVASPELVSLVRSEKVSAAALIAILRANWRLPFYLPKFFEQLKRVFPNNWEKILDDQTIEFMFSEIVDPGGANQDMFGVARRVVHENGFVRFWNVQVFDSQGLYGESTEQVVLSLPLEYFPTIPETFVTSHEASVFDCGVALAIRFQYLQQDSTSFSEEEWLLISRQDAWSVFGRSTEN